MPKTKNPNYSINNLITMTPEMSGKVLLDKLTEEIPDIELIKNILEHSQVNVQGNDGRTALIRASRFGHTEIVKLLLEHPKIDVNVQDKGGWTALMLASGNDYPEIVRMLLERPEILVNVQDNRGETALITASEYGCTEIVSMLLEKPEIDVNVQTIHGYTALLWASQSQNDYPEIEDLIKSHPNFKQT